MRCFLLEEGETADLKDTLQLLTWTFWNRTLFLNFLFMLAFFLITVSGASWGFLLLLYVFVQISRILVVVILYPLLRHFGYGLDLKEATILVWAGLRGAVALSLSLSVKVSYYPCTSQPFIVSLYLHYYTINISESSTLFLLAC